MCFGSIEIVLIELLLQFVVPIRMGMKVAGEESFLLNRLSYYSAELVCKLEGLPSGAYIVAIRVGNESRSVAVVVE